MVEILVTASLNLMCLRQNSSTDRVDVTATFVSALFYTFTEPCDFRAESRTDKPVGSA